MLVSKKTEAAVQRFSAPLLFKKFWLVPNRTLVVVFIFSKDASWVGMQLYQKLTLQLVLSCNFSEIYMILFLKNTSGLLFK